jgi:hypothetical protein
MVKARHPGLVEITRNVEVTRRPTTLKFVLEVLPRHTLVTVSTSLELDEAEVDQIPLLALPAWVVVPYGQHMAVGKRDGRVVYRYDFETSTPRADILLGPSPPTM